MSDTTPHLKNQTTRTSDSPAYSMNQVADDMNTHNAPVLLGFSRNKPGKTKHECIDNSHYEHNLQKSKLQAKVKKSTTPDLTAVGSHHVHFHGEEKDANKLKRAHQVSRQSQMCNTNIGCTTKTSNGSYYSEYSCGD